MKEVTIKLMCIQGWGWLATAVDIDANEIYRGEYHNTAETSLEYAKSFLSDRFPEFDQMV